MEEIGCEVRFEVDESRQSPGRLRGVIISYEKQSGDRKEIVGSWSIPLEGRRNRNQ